VVQVHQRVDESFFELLDTRVCAAGGDVTVVVASGTVDVIRQPDPLVLCVTASFPV
jgi:hypothetical protein